MKEKIKLGIVGLGARGFDLLTNVIVPMKDTEVLAVCDLYEDRAKSGFDKVKEVKGNEPLCTLDYKEVTRMEGLDAIIVSTAWEMHIPVAIDAMRHGKYVGMEVGGAYSLDDCFELVRVSEETGMPCMLLENCCYDRRELMVLNMVKQGIFGEVVHCAGAYYHDLRYEVSHGKELRHYRLRNYIGRNCENYPTHELGPIAKVLNINRGNRMVSLTSVASKAAGLHQYILDKKSDDTELVNTKFAQGDIITTTITCANGETIVITLGTTLPRAYSRNFTVHGTKAAFFEDTDSLYIDGVHNAYEDKPRELWGNIENYREQYDHPIWKEYLAAELKGGHGGIDWLVFRAFFESVKNEVNTPIDVYDAAAWMCISTLSEESIKHGGAPVAIPDFTRGKWLKRESIHECKFCLDKVCVDETVDIMD